MRILISPAIITRAAATALTVGLAGVAAAQDNATDAKRLVEVLGVHPGSVLADIGAGDAQLTIPMAAEVGPSGRIYATDLGGEPLERLRQAITKAGATNVEIVEGHPLRTNLPPACCDGIFIRYVYHHFADPSAMNASLLQSLKPGGRLAIIEFAPNGPEAESPADRAGGKTHGVAAETAARELERAGFERVMVEHEHDRTILVVLRKPAPPDR